MKTSGPLDVITQLVNAMNTCQLESALALFEPGAAFVSKPGAVVTGPSGIRQALEVIHGTEANVNDRSSATRGSR